MATTDRVLGAIATALVIVTLALWLAQVLN